MSIPHTTDRASWLEQIGALRVREKAHTAEGDAIAAARRRLPMTEIPAMELIGPSGPVSLVETFRGRDELIVYQHMFHDGQPHELQCEGCTITSWAMQDAADAAHLEVNGVGFAVFADGPYEEIAAFREFMGYTAPWYSSAGIEDPLIAEGGCLVSLLRKGERVFATSQITGRGVEAIMPTLQLLDMTAHGRREDWEDAPGEEPQRLPACTSWRTDENGTPVGNRRGRPVFQWTRPGAAAVEGAEPADS